MLRIANETAHYHSESADKLDGLRLRILWILVESYCVTGTLRLKRHVSIEGLEQ